MALPVLPMGSGNGGDTQGRITLSVVDAEVYQNTQVFKVLELSLEDSLEITDCLVMTLGRLHSTQLLLRSSGMQGFSS